MSLKREFWTRRAIWREAKTEGEEFVMFNNKPLFRYNSYFGIHTVHFMKLWDIKKKRFWEFLK